ncbi:MAG: type II and III secretion system protein family protein [marine benthic group bacterium]|nr:type II and III secretion system protein family protein [Candidatus Benthicola marisminoris]
MNAVSRRTRIHRLSLRVSGLALAVLACLAVARPAPAQDAVASSVTPTGVINLALGNSHVVSHPVVIRRVSIADPAVADAVPVSSQEIVVNGKASGTTTLLLWDNSGGRRMYQVHVAPDVQSLQEDLRDLFPNDSIAVIASGGSVILSGRVSQQLTAERAVSIATGFLGVQEGDASIVNHISVPDPGQVLLQVRFAEVSRTSLEKAGINLLRVGDDYSGGWTTGRPPAPGGQLPVSGEIGGEVTQTFSDALNIFLIDQNNGIGAFIQALKSNGLFRSLAEPNLLAVHGEEASFLAGGEFPYPVVQGGANVGAVTIQFREYGIRLNFTPEIQPSGNIRLHVAPEVSTLDFANGLTLQGFNIPQILSRKAETEIELLDGQTFAIAGLMDNSTIEDIDKIPVLGDIPILGSLFRSKELRQNKTELLVLVTPRLVRPMDESPPVPTGEPDVWDWDDSMLEPLPTIDGQ